MDVISTLRRGITLGAVGALAISGTALAGPGDLDASFGGDGVVEVLPPPEPVHTMRGGDLAAAPSNGLWLVASDQHSYSGLERRGVITRLRADGTLHPGFGDGGQVVWSFDDRGGYPLTTIGSPVALPSGGVQVSGNWSDGWDDPEPRGFVVRFDASGDLDSTFNDDGVLALRPGPNGSSVGTGADLAVRACDHMDRSVRVRAFEADGQVDRAFGRRGTAKVRVPGEPAYRRLVGCGVDADGAVLVATYGGEARSKLRISRLSPDGEIDRSYGDGGTVEIGADQGVHPSAMEVMADGALRLVGQAEDALYPGVLAITSGGELDLGFGGGDGVAVLEHDLLVAATGTAVAIAPNGALGVTGTVENETPYAAWLRPDGVLDTRFGDDGVTFGYVTAMRAVDAVVDGSGRLVTSGTTTRLNGPVTVARFQR